MRLYLLCGHVSYICALHRNTIWKADEMPYCLQIAPGASTGKIFLLFDFLQIPFWFLHMQLHLIGHMKSSGLMADLTWCSLLLKAAKLDQVTQGFGQSRTSNSSNSTASVGSQSQYLVTLTVKNFFPAFIGISLAVPHISLHLCLSCFCL